MTSSRYVIAGMTVIVTLAWAFVLLVVSVPLALLLLAVMIGLAYVRRRRDPRAHRAR